MSASVTSLPSRPPRVAFRARSDLVARGLVSLLRAFDGRLHLVAPQDRQADIAVYEAWTVPAARVVLGSEAFARKPAPVLLSPCDNAALIRAALQAGARGYLSPRLDAERLVEALERVHRGEVVVERTATADRPSHVPRQVPPAPSGDLPAGLSPREVDVLVLVADGLTNTDIAAATYLSPNTVKSYLRNAYRKIGATNRVEAVIWIVENLPSELAERRPADPAAERLDGPGGPEGP